MPDKTPTIALIYWPSSSGEIPHWPYEKRMLPHAVFHAAETLRAWAAQTEAEYALIWDQGLGAPSLDICLELLQKPGEVHHAGLLLGQGMQPNILEKVKPIGLLNQDVPAGIASDSWRLSLRVCLVKTEIIRTVGVFRADFDHVDMAGLEWGYRMFRAGALMRHDPAWAPRGEKMPVVAGSLRDQFQFLALHFERKWVLWATIRCWLTGAKTGETFRALRHSRAFQKISVNTISRIEDIDNQSFNSKKWAQQISVLAPTLDRYPYLLNTLEQCQVQTIQALEILITDQTKAEHRWSGLAESYPNVRVFPQDEMGQCVAWNKLLDEAKGSYVLFLGDDADGIRPDFIEKMCRTMDAFQADMVASHVLEIGGEADNHTQRVVKMAEGFPIVLIKKDLVLRAGKMDMAFNRGIRADQDLALRCRQLGAHMVFDSDLRILHHRAPVGGLRQHQQRVVTRHISKHDPFKIQYPAESEYYLLQKHFNSSQRREHGYMLFFSQFLVRGGVWNKMLRMGYFMGNFRQIYGRFSRIWRS